MREGQKGSPLPKIFFTQDEALQSLILPKEVPKNINHVTHSLSSADISIFSPEISKLCYIKKHERSITEFLILLTSFESLKVVLRNKFAIFYCVLEIGYFKIIGKVDDVIIFAHDGNIQILSRDSSYITNIIIRAKLGNSSISIRETLIIAIL